MLQLTLNSTVYSVHSVDRKSNTSVEFFLQELTLTEGQIAGEEAQDNSQLNFHKI